MTNITGVISYAVFSDTAQEASLHVMQSSHLPVLGNYYVDEGGVIWRGVYYIDRSARFIGPHGNFYLWEVNYTLGGSRQFDHSEDAEQTFLLSFEATFEDMEESGVVDLDGRFNMNTLGEYLHEPLRFKRGVMNLTFRRREFANPLNNCARYRGRINSEPLFGFPPHTVRLADMSYSSTVTESETTYDVLYRLQYDALTWDVVKPNSSFYYRANGLIHRVLNEDGSPSETPALVSEQGIIIPTGSSPPLLTFRVYDEADLNDLALPDPFEL